MTLGKAPTHEDLYRSSREFCEERLPQTSIYRLLAHDGHRLFPDEAFADLFDDVGRQSVPPRIVGTVMTLQRIEGLSDREAVERFTFDARWKYAAGGLDWDHPGFVHTVLVSMRARLRRSERPNRIFEAVLEVAKQAGLVGRKRVLDSTALYDAVATQDTVTLVRSAIRALLQTVDPKTAARLRAVLKRDDDYVAAGKPACDWDDEAAREVLVDALARDAYALLAELVRHRRRQRDRGWKERYRSTRPKVERKIGHLMRRRHGGRRARMRGSTRNAQDFALLAAAVNLRRLAVLGVRHTATGWST